jgi:hypothetical protein
MRLLTVIAAIASCSAAQSAEPSLSETLGWMESTYNDSRLRGNDKAMIPPKRERR